MVEATNQRMQLLTKYYSE